MEPSRGSQRLAQIVATSTQDAVAKTIGVSQQTVSDWLRGKMKPRGENMLRLSVRLKIEPVLWFEKPQPEPPPTLRTKKGPSQAAKPSRRKPARSRSAKSPGPKKARATADQAAVERPRGETRAA